MDNSDLWQKVELTNIDADGAASQRKYRLSSEIAQNNFELEDFDRLGIKLECAKISCERPWLEPQIFKNDACGLSNRDPHDYSNGTLPS